MAERGEVGVYDLGRLAFWALAALCSCGEPAPAQAPRPLPAARVNAASTPSVLAPPPVAPEPSAPAQLRPFVMPARQNGSHQLTPALKVAPERPLTKAWKTRVGLTTFRTTLAATEQAIVIGTHGATLNGQNEASDGVYVLAPKTGKLLRFIPTPGKGDKDVAGVALDGTSAVVFSTDNGQVVRARLDDGALLWKASLSGKVRPAPALGQLNGVGALDVVIGAENGELSALDGDSGRALWTKMTGVNDYDARGFVAAAAIADLDADGLDDVVAGARDGALVAYSGRDGHELWSERDGSGIHASPSIGDFDGDGRLEVLAAWSYSRLAIFDAASGALRYEQRLEQDRGGIEGLFASPVPLPRRAGPALLVQGTSWWGGHRGDTKSETIDGALLVGQAGREFRSDEGRVTASAIVMDLGDDGSWEAVLGTEAGELLALGADGTRQSLAKLGGPIEATALAADVDGDDLYELLVASNDGWLTCFQTGSRTIPLVSRFRGSASENRGALRGVDLHWALAAR